MLRSHYIWFILLLVSSLSLAQQEVPKNTIIKRSDYSKAMKFDAPIYNEDDKFIYYPINNNCLIKYKPQYFIKPLKIFNPYFQHHIKALPIPYASTKPRVPFE